MIPVVGPAISGALEGVGSASSKAIVRASESIPGAYAALRRGGLPALRKVGTTMLAHPALSAAGAAAAAGGVAAAIHRGSVAKMHPALRAAMGGGRRRRMNVCNQKALRRSLRRAHGFARVAMKTIHLVHPKKHVTFGGFKKHRKRAA